MPPSLPPQPMMPGGGVLRVDDDAVADVQAGDLGADLDDLAGRLVAERRPASGRSGGVGAPPIWTKIVSVPQMPHARMRTTTSSARPTAARW